jgi:hypothetical protein
LPLLSFPRPRFLARIAAGILAAGMLAFAGCRPAEPASPATVPEGVVFTKVAPKLGRVSIEDTTNEIRLSARARAPGGAPNRAGIETTERVTRREEVLAIFDRIVTKKRVTFERFEKQQIANGTPQPAEKNVLAGHTYLVELRQGSLVATDGLGREISDAEKKELSRVFAGFGKSDPFLDGIPDGVVLANQPASGMKSGFLEMFEGAEEGPDVGNVDVRFVGARDHAQGRCGVFAFKVAIQMAGEPRLSMDIDGEFLVRLSDSAPIALMAHGPARLTGRQKIEDVDVQIDGSGEMRSSVRFTYP